MKKTNKLCIVGTVSLSLMSIRGPNSWNMYNHLEQDMEQWTDSKSGTEYVKVV